MGLLPRDPSRCARGCDGSRETTPLQRSACDNAEVSLFPVSVFASPGWQTRFRLIRLIALFHSLKEKKVIAGSKSPWLGILTPIQVTYLMVCMKLSMSVKGAFRLPEEIPFTYTDIDPPFFNPLDEYFLKKVLRCYHVITPQSS